MGCPECVGCMGCNGNFSAMYPFNSSFDFHAMCQIDDWNNQTQVEAYIPLHSFSHCLVDQPQLCRLANLPDINQTVPYVQDWLLVPSPVPLLLFLTINTAMGEWNDPVLSIRRPQDRHRPRGGPHFLGPFLSCSPPPFSSNPLSLSLSPSLSRPTPQSSYVSSAGCFAIGEVDNGDIEYVAPYQAALPSVLNYPLFYLARQVFADAESFLDLTEYLSDAQTAFLVRPPPPSSSLVLTCHDRRTYRCWGCSWTTTTTLASCTRTPTPSSTRTRSSSPSPARGTDRIG